MSKTLQNVLLVILAAFVLTPPAMAHGFKIGDLEIGHPWSRATPNGAKVGGGYLSITNHGSTSDRLVGASLSIAGHGEIHEMKMDNGVMQMRPLADGIEIKPGETVKFEPGGYHLMFMDLTAPLKEGDMVKGQLTFEKAGKVDVEFKVDAIGASAPSHGDHMNGGAMKMDKMHDMH
jgi:copper(I)-binding protein